jgi:hypothetical protein
MQRQSSVGASDDPLEQEADRVADQVLAASPSRDRGGEPPRIHRFTGQPAGQADEVPVSAARALVDSGKPLEPALRHDMESRFGRDFSRVRVHAGEVAEQSARDLNANAYTMGYDIVFGRGRLSPGTQQGRHLIAHELTHVVQQSGAGGIQLGRDGEMNTPPHQRPPFHQGGHAVESKVLQRQPAEDLQSYDVEGGQYSPKEKKTATQDPAGLILTASVVGKYENELSGRAPMPITVSKQWMRFEGGRLGQFVSSYNDFTSYLGEVLQSIGRLRDLLSAGAPEIPDEMTANQKRALRPTDDTQSSVVKKEAYRDWREAQAEYATPDKAGGNTFSGLAFDAARADRDFDAARQIFWEAKGQLSRSIEAGKRLDKPKYDALDLSLSDAVSLLDPWTAAAVAIDKLVDARQKRIEYDAKMKEFGDAVKTANESVRDDFEAFKRAGSTYWTKFAERQALVQRRDKARVESRQRAALLGQATAAPSETRSPVLAEVRMPELVADAWHALAVIAPSARERLRVALAERGVVERASLTDLSWRGHDPLELQDITQLRRAWQRTLSWEDILTPENLKEWARVDKLWEETFTKFNV